MKGAIERDGAGRGQDGDRKRDTKAQGQERTKTANGTKALASEARLQRISHWPANIQAHSVQTYAESWQATMVGQLCEGAGSQSGRFVCASPNLTYITDNGSGVLHFLSVLMSLVNKNNIEHQLKQTKPSPNVIKDNYLNETWWQISVG